MLDIDAYMVITLDELDELLEEGTISIIEYKNYLHLILERMNEEMFDIQIDLEDDRNYRSYVNINNELMRYIELERDIHDRLKKYRFLS